MATHELPSVTLSFAGAATLGPGLDMHGDRKCARPDHLGVAADDAHEHGLVKGFMPSTATVATRPRARM
jgi:hypothetical protein